MTNDQQKRLKQYWDGLDSKKKTLLNLALKGGKEAELVLLDKIHELEDEIVALKKEVAAKDPTAARVVSVQKQADEMAKAAEMLFEHVKAVKTQNEAEFRSLHNSLSAFQQSLATETKAGMDAARKESMFSTAIMVEKMLEDGQAFIEKRIQDFKAPPQAVTPDTTLQDKLAKIEDEVTLDATAIRKLTEEIAGLKTGGRVGWGAHPLTVQQDGVVKGKVVRVINFIGGTVELTPAGVLNVTTGSGTTTSELILQDSTDLLFQDGGIIQLNA